MQNNGMLLLQIKRVDDGCFAQHDGKQQGKQGRVENNDGNFGFIIVHVLTCYLVLQKQKLFQIS